MCNTKEAKIRDKIEKAVNKLKEKDACLLEINVNERTISHILAMYLKPSFRNWDVDCEYNRDKRLPPADDERSHKTNYQKILDIPVESCLESDDTDAKTVYPDIIVHKRGTDKNLLVIEIKKSTNGDTESRNFDKKKLNAFMNQLKYQYAAFLEIEIKGKPAQTPGIEIKSGEERFKINLKKAVEIMAPPAGS